MTGEHARGAGPGDIFAALFAGHQVGDYWAQTHAQACVKALPGPEGRAACIRHVASLTACKLAALAALRASGRRVSWRRAALAVAADAALHYAADRRAPLESAARLLEGPMGKLTFYRLGSPRAGHDDRPCLGTGAYALDQAFHIGCLWAAAVVASERSA